MSLPDEVQYAAEDRALRRERAVAFIRHRALDAARRELFSMQSELEHYGTEFTGPQLLAMRAVMRSLRKYITALEK